jgi:hypothetical protein
MNASDRPTLWAIIGQQTQQLGNVGSLASAAAQNSQNDSDT